MASRLTCRKKKNVASGLMQVAGSKRSTDRQLLSTPVANLSRRMSIMILSKLQLCRNARTESVDRVLVIGYFGTYV
jgi:hypothetical protein